MEKWPLHLVMFPISTHLSGDFKQTFVIYGRTIIMCSIKDCKDHSPEERENVKRFAEKIASKINVPVSEAHHLVEETYTKAKSK